MKILHFSDTHLGFQAFDHVNGEGVNTREQDVYDAFERVVDRILEVRPDVAVHSGDFFHRPSPSNRALTFGLEQLRRISARKIPVVILAGNHETPKTVYNSPILRALRSIDHIYPFFSDTAETAVFDGLAVHGVPHINDISRQKSALEEIKADPARFNILMLHTSLGKRYLMEEYGEQIFPEAFEYKLADFQYLALGHWHNCQRIDLHSNAWYSGSVERLSDTEIGSEKGFLWLETSDNKNASVLFEAVPTRPWLKFEIADCKDKSVAEIGLELEDFIQRQDIEASIVSLHFQDIKPEQSIEISNAKLKSRFNTCFQLIVKRKTLSDRIFAEPLESGRFESLDKVFADYVRTKMPPASAEPILERVKKYWNH